MEQKNNEELNALQQENNTENQEPDKRTKLQKKIDGMNEKQWRVWQCIGGVVLGLAVCFFLLGDDGESMLGIYSFVLALLVPKLLENSFRRSVNDGRIAMVITIAVILIARLIQLIATGRFFAN